jgi:hypothetical protein
MRTSASATCFKKADLPRLKQALRVPDEVVVIKQATVGVWSRRHVFADEEALLFTLARLAFLGRLLTHRPWFGRDETQWSRLFNHMIV